MSTDKPCRWLGSYTKPNVFTLPVSGFRLGLPKLSPVIWPFGSANPESGMTPLQASARFGVAANFAEVRPLHGSLKVTEVLTGGEYKSNIVGTLKTCAKVPRTNRSVIGRYSTLNSPLVVLPNRE